MSDRIWTVEELRELPVGTRFYMPWHFLKPTGTIRLGKVVETGVVEKYMAFDKG